MGRGEAAAPWWAVAKEQAQPFLKTRDQQQPDPLTKNWLTVSQHQKHCPGECLSCLQHVVKNIYPHGNSLFFQFILQREFSFEGKNDLPTFKKKPLLISTIEPYQCFQLHNQRLLIKALAGKLRSLRRGNLNSSKAEKQHKVKICHRSAEMILAPFDRSTNAEAPSAATHSSPCKNCLVPRRDHHGNHHKSFAGACAKRKFAGR